MDLVDDNGTYQNPEFDDNTETSVTRCVLVTGISQLSSGLGLKRLLASTISQHQQDLKINVGDEPTKKNKTQFIIRFNIHKCVRDGCAHILFSNSHEALGFLKWISDLRTPILYESRVLFFSLGASHLRDHFFPSLPFETRRLMKLDPVATFSVTGEVASLRMSTAIVSGILPPVLHYFKLLEKPILVVDATAGVGGNTLGIIRAVCAHHLVSPRHTHVVCVELDETRCELLRENLTLALPHYLPNCATLNLERASSDNLECSDMNPLAVTLKNGCGYASSIAYSTKSKGVRILFFDPPWGGPAYSEKGEIEMLVIDADTSVNMSFAEILRRLCGLSSKALDMNSYHIVASKLPATYNFTTLARSITNAENYGQYPGARLFPFKFHFDATMVLFVVVANPFISSSEEKESNYYLDDLVESINRWHGKGVKLRAQPEDCGGACQDTSPREPWGKESFEGIGLVRPEFYDFEKDRWIQLKKWIPSRRREGL